MWVFWVLMLGLILTFAIFSETTFSFVLLMVILVVSIIFIALNRIKPNVSLDIKIPKRCEKSQNISGFVIIKNNGFLSYRLAKILLKFENQLTGEKSIVNLKSSLFSKNKCEFEFEFQSDFCGTVNIFCEKLRLYDFLGLTYKTVYLDNNFKITVLPDIFSVKINVKSNCTSDNENIRCDDKIGQDLSEVLDFREYVAGDSLRQIQWKLSQKHRKLIIKEGSQPATQYIALLMLNGKNSTAENSSVMAETFVSISQSLCESRIYHKIFLFNPDYAMLDSYEISNEEDLFSLIPKILAEKRLCNSKNIFEDFDFYFENIICITNDNSIFDLAEKYCSSVFVVDNIEQDFFEIDI